MHVSAAALGLSPADRRWVEFRLADAGWRSAAAAHRTNQSDFEKAIAELNRLR